LWRQTHQNTYSQNTSCINGLSFRGGIGQKILKNREEGKREKGYHSTAVATDAISGEDQGGRGRLLPARGMAKREGAKLDDPKEKEGGKGRG